MMALMKKFERVHEAIPEEIRDEVFGWRVGNEPLPC